MPEEKKSQKIRLTLSAQAERYARRDAPVGVRRMAARGALPLPPIELATVLFVLLHDSDTEVKTRARESLEKLPDRVYTAVVSGAAHPAVLSHLAHVLKDRPASISGEAGESQAQGAGRSAVQPWSPPSLVYRRRLAAGTVMEDSANAPQGLRVESRDLVEFRSGAAAARG